MPCHASQCHATFIMSCKTLPYNLILMTLYQMKAIGAFIANSTEYDVVLLQDLLMRPDHETIRAMLPPGGASTPSPSPRQTG